jgi:uncharacterized protein YqjF (DUF2071 family)
LNLRQKANAETSLRLTDILKAVAHRPYPLPKGRWRLAQRWNDLLFAHWPIPAADLAPLLPPGLEPDLFDGSAWVGVVPFWMDHVRTRGVGDLTFGVPGTRTFPELNLRTYVRSRQTGLAGVYFFALEAGSPLAVIGARILFGLPYFLARIRRTTTPTQIDYSSRRLLSWDSVRFEATYRSLGHPDISTPSQPGSLEYFLTERYALFTPRGRHLSVGHIHHLPWPLEPAEAEIRINELPAAHGITLPGRAPILHFARSLEVFLWSLSPDAPPGSPPGNASYNRS